MFCCQTMLRPDRCLGLLKFAVARQSYSGRFIHPSIFLRSTSRPLNAFVDRVPSANFNSMARGKDGRPRQRGKSTHAQRHQSTIAKHDQPQTSAPPTSTTAPQDGPRFSDLRSKNIINSTILNTLTEDLQFDHMMPVQAATLEYLLQGKDCLAQAKTGTGKTLAFLLPAIETILRNDTRRLSALVLCPTRELALQIAAEATKVLQRMPQFKVATSIGGTNKGTELIKILAGCDILVATPGRLLDHLSEPEVQHALGSLQTLVLDEADRMVDMGFLPDMKKIISYLPKLPRQTMLFSATIDDQVKSVSHLFLKKDYEYISTIPPGEAATHERVDQYLVSTPSFVDHAPSLISVVKSELATSTSFKAIVFAPTAGIANFYGHVLSSTGGLPQVSVLHSRLSQSKRARITQDFRQATNAICVATDVIARGMDFPEVTHVFQVGLPADRESYIHRLGRTARAGAEGRGILILSSAEKVFLNQLKGIHVQEYPSALKYSLEDIQPALETLEDKQHVYQAWLGFYKTYLKLLRWSTSDVVREANTYALVGLGCPEVPALEKSTVGKMGLKGVPGLVVVPNAPRSNNPGARGGGEGRLKNRAPGKF